MEVLGWRGYTWSAVVVSIYIFVQDNIKHVSGCDIMQRDTVKTKYMFQYACEGGKLNERQMSAKCAL